MEFANLDYPVKLGRDPQPTEQVKTAQLFKRFLRAIIFITSKCKPTLR